MAQFNSSTNCKKKGVRESKWKMTEEPGTAMDPITHLLHQIFRVVLIAPNSSIWLASIRSGFCESVLYRRFKRQCSSSKGESRHSLLLNVEIPDGSRKTQVSEWHQFRSTVWPRLLVIHHAERNGRCNRSERRRRLRYLSDSSD